jgi:alkylation response protein AidB-like acyl-CoA dehydrogenase
VFAQTLGYLKERRQFDRAIGEFQALQHRAAELYIDIELTRALVLGALQAVDQNSDADPAKAALIVAQAKAHACATANRAVQEGVQMHGGIGMTDEFDIGLYMKRAHPAGTLRRCRLSCRPRRSDGRVLSASPDPACAGTAQTTRSI